MRRLLSEVALAVVLSAVALGVAGASRGESPFEERPSPGIYVAPDGTYTNLPRSHGAVERFVPSRDRVTPVRRTAPVYDWAAVNEELSGRDGGYDGGYDGGDAGDYCVDAYVGTASRGASVTLCGGERATVGEERVLRRGHVVTTTDTVLRIDGREVMRVLGRDHEHRP